MEDQEDDRQVDSWVSDAVLDEGLPLVVKQEEYNEVLLVTDPLEIMEEELKEEFLVMDPLDIKGEKLMEEGMVRDLVPQQKPYECQKCHSGFTKKSSLTTHLRTHKWGEALQIQSVKLGFQRKVT